MGRIRRCGNIRSVQQWRASLQNAKHPVKFDIIAANPHDVLFANDTIMDHFSCGRSVHATISGLAEGRLSVEDIPLIRVVRRGGRLVTLDHRRLYAFKKALPADAQVPMKLILTESFVEKYLGQGTKPSKYRTAVHIEKSWRGRHPEALLLS